MNTMNWHPRINLASIISIMVTAVQATFGFVSLLPTCVAAESVALAVGEYAPFVAEKLPAYGMTAAIVSAVFKTQGIDVRYSFLPWKRGYEETKVGKYVGTFPYLKTSLREAEFLYSKPIYTDHFRLFVRHGSESQVDWFGKSICIPLGYDSTQIQHFTDANKMRLEHPPDISNCLKMLELSRIDAVWVSELVAANTARVMFGKNAQVYPLEISLTDENKYYFIVSNTLPGAKEWIKRFDAGLKQIQSDGTYAKILQRSRTD